MELATSPADAIDHVRNKRFAYSEKLGNIPACMGFAKCAHGSNIGIAELVIMVGFASVFVASFCDLVVRVHLGVAEKMMGWIAAFPVIARMKNVSAVRDFTINGFKGYTVRSQRGISSPVANRAISSLENGACPIPTSISAAGFINLGPEPFIKTNFRSAGVPARPRAVFTAIGWWPVVGGSALPAFAFCSFLFQFFTA